MNEMNEKEAQSDAERGAVRAYQVSVAGHVCKLSLAVAEPQSIKLPMDWTWTLFISYMSNFPASEG